MKKTAARTARKLHSCRKCGQSDFKRWMDVVKHLRRCKGPADSTAPVGGKKNGSAMVEALSEISRQIGSLKEGVDALIKRLA